MKVAIRAETVDAYAIIRDHVIDQLEERRIPLGQNIEQVREVVQECVQAYQARAHLGSGRALADRASMASQILASVTDFGPLAELFSRPYGVMLVA